jgi:hypothetical protein
MKIIIVLLALLLVGRGSFGQSAEELRVPTRYGTFTLGENQMLLYKGVPLQPPVQGNSGFDLGTPYHIGASDVVLATIFGGTACPYLYQFVTVTKSGAKATQKFGTCNELIRARRSRDSILLTMHGYRGPFEPEAEKKKAQRETHEFVFLDGAVTKDGKPAN